MKRAIPSIAVLAAIVAAVPSSAAKPEPWATVNICDTPGHPNQMGVRASMLGNGTRQRMYMRFRALFFNSNGKWENVKGPGLSKFIYAGSAKFANRQAGYTFSFSRPSGASRFVLRGLVAFEYRERKKGRERLVRRFREYTKGGYPAARGGDPPGYATGVCEIRP